MNIHAGLVALHRRGGWIGALILGPSGSGKSDLAVRALDHGLTLVADDRVILWVSQGVLYGRAPDVLAERIEARQLGVLRATAAPFARVVLGVSCEAPEAVLERLPLDAPLSFEGVSVPALRMKGLEASAPAKLRRALERVGAGAWAP